MLDMMTESQIITKKDLQSRQNKIRIREKSGRLFLRPGMVSMSGYIMFLRHFLFPVFSIIF